jgi:hypothetical protein
LRAVVSRPALSGLSCGLRAVSRAFSGRGALGSPLSAGRVLSGVSLLRLSPSRAGGSEGGAAIASGDRSAFGGSFPRSSLPASSRYFSRSRAASSPRSRPSRPPHPRSIACFSYLTLTPSGGRMFSSRRMRGAATMRALPSTRVKFLRSRPSRFPRSLRKSSATRNSKRRIFDPPARSMRVMSGPPT